MGAFTRPSKAIVAIALLILGNGISSIVRRVAICMEWSLLNLDGRRHNKLQHDRAAEVLKDQIKDAPKAENDSMPARGAEPEDTMKQGPNMEKAQKHIETLKRIQKAEKKEHVAMLLTIEEWRSALEEKPDKLQEKDVRTKEKLLHRRMQEWREREHELGGFRTRLEGDVSSV